VLCTHVCAAQGIDPSTGFPYYRQFAMEVEYRYSSADGKLLVISVL
jgi:hypothetical protein